MDIGYVCNPEKKTGPKYGPEKGGCKKLGHYYSKREEARLPLLFLNNIDPVVLHPAFSGSYFGPDFFKVPDHKDYQVDLIN